MNVNIFLVSLIVFQILCINIILTMFRVISSTVMF